MTWGNRIANAGLAGLIASMVLYVAMGLLFAIAHVNGIAMPVEAMVWPFLGMIAGAALIAAGMWMESAR